MGSGPDKVDHVHELTYLPTKISMLISRPNLSPENATSPHQTTISVPFKWEESPGKPRHYHSQSVAENTARTTTLELPPRLLFLEPNKVPNIDGPSPTTVLDGPYIMGRAMSFTSSYRTSKENWNSNFGSSRWSGFKKTNTNREGDEGSFDFSGHCTANSNTKVKLTRVRRGGSSWSLSMANSHLWASIYDSFKQVVPWRRRKETERKWASKTDIA